MANKFEKLVEATVVEAVPVLAVAARAALGAGRAIARGIVGPAPTKAGRSAGRVETLKHRKTMAGIQKNMNQLGGRNDAGKHSAAARDWLKANDSDQAAKIAKETIRNNKGTGGSNVVTSGNKTTNHTSNYNQVRKKDLQNYSATKQGQPPVKDDDSGNPLITQNNKGSQGSGANAKSAGKSSVSGKFRNMTTRSASAGAGKNTETPTPATPPTTTPPTTTPPTPTPAAPPTTTQPASFRSRVVSTAKDTTQGVSNVILKHLGN